MAPGCGYTTMVEQMAGDPVELLTGSLNWNYTDLEIDGDEPLAFTRTYHSWKRITPTEWETAGPTPSTIGSRICAITFC